MSSVIGNRWILLFLAVALLVLAQVAWWATLFLREVDSSAALKLQTREMAEKLGDTAVLEHVPTRDRILREAERRRVMFVSEAMFFSFLACLGLYLIFHALKAEARSREIQRNFIEVVSHESKTPLTAMKLRIESVREKFADPALSRELGLALDEVRRLTSIFDKVMGLNRVERQAFRFERISLGEVVGDTTRRIEPFLRDKGVTLDVRIEGEVFVRGDAHGLGNAVQSLVENAALYNDKPDKRIDVVVKEEYSVAVVSVSDNGPGIDPEEAPRLFQRFYRGLGGRRVPGTGLGLYIARSIAVAHQGDVRLAPANGAGARFELVLPAVKA